MGWDIGCALASRVGGPSAPLQDNETLLSPRGHPQSPEGETPELGCPPGGPTPAKGGLLSLGPSPVSRPMYPEALGPLRRMMAGRTRVSSSLVSQRPSQPSTIPTRPLTAP